MTKIASVGSIADKGESNGCNRSTIVNAFGGTSKEFYCPPYSTIVGTSISGVNISVSGSHTNKQLVRLSEITIENAISETTKTIYVNTRVSQTSDSIQPSWLKLRIVGENNSQLYPATNIYSDYLEPSSYQTSDPHTFTVPDTIKMIKITIIVNTAINYIDLTSDVCDFETSGANYYAEVNVDDFNIMTIEINDITT